MRNNPQQLGGSLMFTGKMGLTRAALAASVATWLVATPAAAQDAAAQNTAQPTIGVEDIVVTAQ